MGLDSASVGMDGHSIRIFSFVQEYFSPVVFNKFSVRDKSRRKAHFAGAK
jgi:hypothetical protein